MLTRRTFLQLMAASTGVAITGSEFLAQTAARASTALSPNGSNGIKHVVVLMMENRSFDHFLGWLPGADGRHDLTFPSTDGNYYPNYRLAPDFQGCGYSDPDHSWEGFLIQHNFGKMDGFLQRPTAPEANPGVTLAAANTFPVGYYTNHHHDHQPKAVPDLPVIGALAEHYTVLDRYFCSFAGETFPNRFYQHAARTDRDHNGATISTLPAIWDMLSPIPNNQGIPTGGYFFRDVPFLALWGTKYFPFWHPFAQGDADALGIPVTTLPFIDTVAQGLLPNVSFVDPAFDTEGSGTSADDHPLADIRLGERFIADTFHALASAGYLDNTVHAEAHRDHLRARPPDLPRRSRRKPGPGPRTPTTAAGAGPRHPDQQPGAGAGQRRRGRLQRQQRPVGLPGPDAPWQPRGAGSRHCAVRGPDGCRHGGIRPPVPAGPGRIGVTANPSGS
jgi:phospholipase C